MRRILLIVIVSLLLLTLAPASGQIHAEEISEGHELIQMLGESSTTFSNYKIVEETENLLEFTMADQEGNTYFAFVEGDTAYITNSQNQELGRISLVESGESQHDFIQEPLGIEMLSSQWNPYYYYGNRTAKMTVSATLVYEVAITVLLALLASVIANWVGATISIASTIAVAIHNATAKEVLISRYVSEWKGCPQYVREYFQFHSLTMTRWFGTQHRGPRMTRPVDFTSPPACRQI